VLVGAFSHVRLAGHFLDADHFALVHFLTQRRVIFLQYLEHLQVLADHEKPIIPQFEVDDILLVGSFLQPATHSLFVMLAPN